MFRVLFLMVFMLSIAGCSLLDVKIESQTTPLTQSELKTRLTTREYADLFFNEIEQTADELSSKAPNNNDSYQASILLWKIKAFEGVQASAFQVIPGASMIDTWAFTAQMHAYLLRHHKDMSVVTDVATRLVSEIEDIARESLGDSLFASSKSFIDGHANHYSVENKLTYRPAYRDWLSSRDVSHESVNQTLGTMPEALGDVSDRLVVVTRNTPKLITWKTQLLALQQGISGEQLRSVLMSVQDTSELMKNFLVDNPEYTEKFVKQVVSEATPLVEVIDDNLLNYLSIISSERQAIELMIVRERMELGSIIESERKALHQSLDEIIASTVVLVMIEIKKLIKESVILFSLFMFVVFFAPLSLGYVLGKRAKIRG